MMAMLIHDDRELEMLLAGASSLERAAMLDMIRPYLSFTPGEDVAATPDCPVCGLYRGSVVPHECLGAN
jgi:hypothetical protein